MGEVDPETLLEWLQSGAGKLGIDALHSGLQDWGGGPRDPDPPGMAAEWGR
jgi:hypothetical protein